MINIGISGAAGRMGKTLIQAVQDTQFTHLSLALEQAGHESVGADAGTNAGVALSGVAISDSMQLDGVDVFIDFSVADAVVEHLKQCVASATRMVIGTTGFSESQLGEVRKSAGVIPIVLAPNMSVGVNLCFSLLKTAARTLGDTVDIEVIEAHHRAKVDAPSGTALKMGEVVAAELGRTLDADGVFERHGFTGARERKSIGFATIRAGDIVGEHTVMFAGEGERVEITHKSNSRMTYAMGALRAAQWLMDKPVGLYEMRDVLNLEK